MDTNDIECRAILHDWDKLIDILKLLTEPINFESLILLISSVIKEEIKISHNKSFELFLCLDNNIFLHEGIDLYEYCNIL